MESFPSLTIPSQIFLPERSFWLHLEGWLLGISEVGGVQVTRMDMGTRNAGWQCDRQKFSLLHPLPWRGVPQVHAKEPSPLPRPAHVLAPVGVDFTSSFSGGHVTPANHSTVPS